MVKLAKIYEGHLREDALTVDGYDDCIVGVTSKGLVVYSKEKMIKKLSKDMTLEEAKEWFWFNIDGAYIGECAPIYLL